MFKKAAASIGAALLLLAVMAAGISPSNKKPQLLLRVRVLDSDPTQAAAAKNAKVLASPSLTALPNQPASFTAGGEVPIVNASGKVQEYAEFGLRVSCTFGWVGNNQDKVWIDARLEMSEPKFDKAVTGDQQVLRLHSDSVRVVGTFAVAQTIQVGQIRDTSGKPMWAELTATPVQ